MEFEGKIENIQKYYVSDYIIIRNSNTFICNCKGFKMSRKYPKACKHIAEVKKLELFSEDRNTLEKNLQKILEEKNRLINNFTKKYPLVKRLELKENENGIVYVDILL